MSASKSGASAIVYAWQQEHRSDLPFVPAPKRNPVSGVVEAAVPAGNEPVHDGRYAELRLEVPFAPPAKSDQIPEALKRLEAQVAALTVERAGQQDLARVREELARLEATVRDRIEAHPANAPPTSPPPPPPSFWSRLKARFGRT